MCTPHHIKLRKLKGLPLNSEIRQGYQPSHSSIVPEVLAKVIRQLREIKWHKYEKETMHLHWQLT